MAAATGGTPAVWLDTLRLDFFEALLVVRDLIDENLSLPSVLPALDDIADAGLASVARSERLGIGQERLDDLEWHYLLARGQGHR